MRHLRSFKLSIVIVFFITVPSWFLQPTFNLANLNCASSKRASDQLKSAYITIIQYFFIFVNSFFK